MDIRRHINENAIYRVVNAGILTCMCLVGLSSFLGIASLGRLHILVAFLVIAVLAGFNFFKGKTRILYIAVILICLCVAAAVVGLQTCLAFLQSYFRWVIGSEALQENLLTGNEALQSNLSVGNGAIGNEALQGYWLTGNGLLQESWVTGYEVMQVIILTMGCYLLQMLLEKFSVIKMGLSCLLFIGLLVCLFTGTNLEHLSVVFLIFYIAMAYVEWVQERWVKAQKSSVKKQMIWIAPFLALYLLLMAVMPAPDKPYDWKWARNIYSQLKESFLEITQNIMRGGREDFGTSLSGFSEDGELKEEVRENNREVMTLSVQTQYSPAANVYLTGRVCDTFDGRQWLRECQEDNRERYIDIMEITYAVRRFDEERYFRDYLYETRVKIRYEYFNTRFMFAPLKTRTVKSSGDDLGFSAEDGALLMKKQRGYGTEYEVRYYQMNLGQEMFGQLLEAKQEPDESLWNTIVREYRSEIGERISLEYLEQYRQRIYDNYLNEITLSQETESYLAEITKDAMTNVEKLRAIERELASYTYTTAPGKLPDWVTDESKFLDYFLLESKQGYCTYFATAFTLLARAEGIPARYVQGYCVPMHGNREYTVTSDMAHSWPEVYIDGVGWIPFEPTPGYQGIRYISWSVKERSGTLPSYVADLPEQEEWEETEENEPEEDEEEITTEEKTDNVLLKLLSIGIPAVLAGCAAVLVSDSALSRYRYGKMSPEGKFREEVHWNLRILSRLGLTKGEQETLQELQERGKRLPNLPPLNFIENYENIVYGGKSAGADIIEEARKERELLLDLLKEKKVWVYLYYLLLLPNHLPHSSQTRAKRK